MIGGDAANRIFMEVSRGRYFSDKDTPEEKEYRERIKESLDKIAKGGGMAEAPDDLI